jgi:hypothetical protein
MSNPAVACSLHAGQRWQATGARDDIIDIVRPVEDEWLWLVRTELGSMVEMADSYIMSSYRLVSSGEEAQPGDTRDVYKDASLDHWPETPQISSRARLAVHRL